MAFVVYGQPTVRWIAGLWQFKGQRYKATGWRTEQRKREIEITEESKGIKKRNRK